MEKRTVQRVAHGTGRVPVDGDDGDDGGRPKGLSLGGVLPGPGGGVPTGAGYEEPLLDGGVPKLLELLAGCVGKPLVGGWLPLLDGEVPKLLGCEPKPLGWVPKLLELLGCEPKLLGCEPKPLGCEPKPLGCESKVLGLGAGAGSAGADLPGITSF